LARRKFSKLKKTFPQVLKRRYGLQIRKTEAVNVKKEWM